MIIELCGLPGCGKTTLANELIRYINDNELLTDVFDRQKLLKRNNYFRRVIRRFNQRLYKFFLNGKNRKNLDLIYKTAMHDSLAESKYIFRLMEISRAINKNTNNNYVLDEGIIQYISSLSYKKSILDNENTNTLLSTLLPHREDYYIIYCSLPVEQTIKHLKKRNRKQKHDRYNIEDTELQQKLLDIKKQNIEIILSQPFMKHKKYLCIDMRDSIDSNIMKITNFIEI